MSGGGKGSATTGYRYLMGLHFGLSHGPLDSVSEIWVSSRVAWSGDETASATFPINNPGLFGGDTREGGINGTAYLMMGEPTQMPNTYLAAKQGGLQPAYRGMATVVFNGLIASNNPYPKPWSFRVQRATKGWWGDNCWYPTKAQILMNAEGAQLNLSRALVADLPNNTNVTFGGTFTTQVVGDFRTGDTQILVASSTGISNGMTVHDAAGAIPSGTLAYLIVGSLVKAMNPAHIAYECLTNPDWGMGYPTSSIDDTAFRAAADQLYSEGFGLCLLWQRQDTIEAFLQQLMDYIGGVLITSRSTGLFQMKLVRGGYDTSTLLSLTQDDVIEIQSYEAPGLAGSTNEIVVKFHDPILHVDGQIAVQNNASIQSQGVIISAKRDFPGIPTLDLAARVAQRELQTVSVPTKRLKIKVNRKAWQLTPADVFKFTFPAYGIGSIVFRVGDIDYGTNTDGAITITALEDIFDLPDASYVAAQPTGWTAPDTSPRPSPLAVAFEATYRDLYRMLSASDLAALPNDAAYACLVAQHPASVSTHFDLWTAVSPAAYAQHGTGDWTPFGLLQSGIGPLATTMTLIDGDNLDIVSTGTAIMIDGEILRIDALDPVTGACTIARGCVDTVPASHAANAVVWFLDTFAACDKVQYVMGEQVNQIPATVASSGTLSIAGQTPASVTVGQRQYLPYPPGNLRANSTAFQDGVQISGELTLTWAHRDRLTEQDQLIDFTQGNIGPESGVTYHVKIYGESGALLVDQSALSGTSFDFSNETTVTGGYYNSSLRVQLWAERGGLASYQKYDGTLTRPDLPPPAPTDFLFLPATQTPGTGIGTLQYTEWRLDIDPSTSIRMVSSYVDGSSTPDTIRFSVYGPTQNELAGYTISWALNHIAAPPQEASGYYFIGGRTLGSPGPVDGIGIVFKLSVNTSSPAVTIAASNSAPFVIDDFVNIVTFGSYVYATSKLQDKIFKLNQSDLSLATTITLTSGDAPMGICTDGTYVYVCASGANVVRKIDPSTDTVAASFPVAGEPYCIAYDNGNLYVYSEANVQIFKYSPAGVLQSFSYKLDYVDVPGHNDTKDIMHGPLMIQELGNYLAFGRWSKYVIDTSNNDNFLPNPFLGSFTRGTSDGSIRVTDDGSTRVT